MAEDLFEALCSIAGVIGNRVSDDQTGWDFLVEFPPQPSQTNAATNLPPDLADPPVSCLVQIKSSRSRKSHCKVKLTNAVRFAKQPIPCFTALFVFDGDSIEPQKIYLQHFWKDEITSALQAARRAHAHNVSALNRVDFHIKFRPIELSSKEALVQQIEETLASIGPSYAADKRKISEEAGYEDGYGKGSFTLHESVDAETFIDVLLGRGGSVTVKDFFFQEERFGIPGQPRLSLPSEGQLSVDVQPTDKCRVTIRRPKSREEMTIPGNIYTPGLPGLPRPLQKIRVQADFLEVDMWRDGRARVNAKLDIDVDMNLKTIRQATAFWSWISEGSPDLAIEIQGRPLIEGHINLDLPPGDAQWRRLNYALSIFLSVVPAERWPDGTNFTMRALFQGLNQLVELANILSEPGVVLTLGSIREGAVDAIKNASSAFMPAYIDFGTTTLFALRTAGIEKVTLRASDLKIKLGRPIIAYGAVYAGSAKDNFALMQDQTKRIWEMQPDRDRTLYSQLDPPTE